MSVTISISNETEQPEEIDHGSCPMCDGQRCLSCNHTGLWREEVFPNQFNIANSNFSRFFRGLGLDPGADLFGEIDARTLAKVLDSADLSAIVREEKLESGGGGPTMVHFGLSREQIQSYVERLRPIVEIAEKREERIVWG